MRSFMRGRGLSTVEEDNKSDYSTERIVIDRRRSFESKENSMVLVEQDEISNLLGGDEGESKVPDDDDEISIPSVTVSFDEVSRMQIVEEAPPVLDVEKEWMSVTGRIEVLTLEAQDEQGSLGTKRLQIICLPEDSFQVSSFLRDRYYRQQTEDESQEVPISSMLEQFATTVLDSCAMQCDTTAASSNGPKSALRKSGEQRETALSRSVTFDKIDIHEFNLTLGDHPSAVSGPPVCLGPEFNASSMSLDDYERRRGVRRHRRQLKIPMKTRCGILQTEGNFSAAEITSAWADALEVRKQRRETLKGGMYKMMYDDFFESAGRKFRRFSDGMCSMMIL